ncbi:MAG: phosphoribosylformylglycinamidine cyclo-ligase [Dictyoglomus sp.]|nr:phosphoribosylformylglycinamidine cyclo-ligase [Dictyoglomus sp.]MCX7941728.1 phosphoribosylformylglycinamidine cyclo-ligase [Dictyoglomaceae bacterium]MDW8189021.1 phosphoribosylformylglycinamidine cyclo-ligase [Dictyoglomus sp.]
MFWKESGEKENMPKRVTYSLAGVHISKVEKSLSCLKPYFESTYTSNVIPFWNGFSSVLRIDWKNYKNPLILLTTDGVGTKLKLALRKKRYDTIGQDLVAMNINDLLTCGAKPIAFLDYFATGRIDEEVYQNILISISKACKAVECSFVGGETAELPGIYKGKDLDLAGFAIGIVEEEDLLPKLNDINEDCKLIGISSSGLHSNGFSLLRYIMKKKKLSWKNKIGEITIEEEVLKPTKLYSPIILPLLKIFKNSIKGIAHITGGGIPGNLPRILPKGYGALIDSSSWEIPEIFLWIIKKGNLSKKEAFKVFNMGIGLILVVKDEKEIIKSLKNQGENAFLIGKVEKWEGIKII